MRVQKSIAVSTLALAALAGTALAQSASDNCSGAATIGAGTYLGSTVGATNDGTATCGSSSTSPDVWYKFTAPAQGGTLVVDTCHVNTNFDTVVSLRNSCPGSGSTLACNDDSPCGETTAGASRVSRAMTAGQTMWIRVAGYLGATGTFGLNVVYNTPNGGPDVTTGRIIDVARFGTNANNTITAYAVGTESCNIGDAPVSWYDSGPRDHEHPVIAQNMFRLKTVNGAARFEQLGQSWLKHGFLSLNSTVGYCGTCITPPDGGDQLGVNCTDIYGAGLNGSQGNLGPRSEVNATTGAFAFPHGTGSGPDGAQGTTVGMRMQVPTPDVTGTQNGGPNFGARYFVDAHYVTMDDARWLRANSTVAINGLNNATYQEVNINNGTSDPTLIGAVQWQKPGIQAWKDIDPTVSLVNADYSEAHPVVTGASITARFIVGAKATDLGNGSWRYEYAVYNLNSHRSAGKFVVPFPAGATATNIGFSAPKSHSGEPFSNAAWTSRQDGNTLVFETETFATNANANAIRWGTMYNFRFDSTIAPTAGNASLNLFRPGAATDPTDVTVANIPTPTLPPVCTADYNQDGVLNADDLGDFITGYFNTPSDPRTDFNGDGTINADDLGDFVTAYFNGC